MGEYTCQMLDVVLGLVYNLILRCISRGWLWAEQLVAAGELSALPLVVLIGVIAQPRLLYALSVDGLAPRVSWGGRVGWVTLHQSCLLTHVTATTRGIDTNIGAVDSRFCM